ncbi:GFA family protein [Rhizobium sp.]|uniref:GFA family protein n=1 Tax=Rhizobium sp. TaxID=391 RepID=UPI0034C63E9D
MDAAFAARRATRLEANHCASDCATIATAASRADPFSSPLQFGRDHRFQSGETSTYAGRSVCPRCGGRLFCLGDRVAEVRIGSLDDTPNDLQPNQEIWIKRRETWLYPIKGAGQYEADAVDAMDPTKN